MASSATTVGRVGQLMKPIWNIRVTVAANIQASTAKSAKFCLAPAQTVQYTDATPASHYHVSHQWQTWPIVRYYQIPTLHVTAPLDTVFLNPATRDVLCVSTVAMVIATTVGLAITNQVPGIHYVRVTYHTTANSVRAFAVPATSTAPGAAVARVVTVKTDGKEDCARRSVVVVRTKEPANRRWRTLAANVRSATVDNTVKYMPDAAHSLVQMVERV